MRNVYVLIGIVFFSFLEASGQNRAVSGSCIQGSVILVQGGDPSNMTYNNKPVYFNGALPVDFLANQTTASTYLYFALSSELGTPEDRWVIGYDGQPYYYFISNSEIAPLGDYLPFDTQASVSSCGGIVSVSIECISLITPVFSAVEPICLGQTLSPLPLNSLSDASTGAIIHGTWTPELNNAQTTTYTFTPNQGQCAIANTLEIIVNPTSNYYIDSDSDGYGSGAATAACTAPTGYVTTNTDCNNSNAAVNPAATEICNSIDDDCDTQIDEGVQINYYADTDGDGYGAGTATLACTAPTGFVTTSTDCNNTNPAVNPAATEICNSIDDDCDTQIDDGLTFTNYYADVDVDGFGAGAATNACAQPSGFVTTNTDCNNTNAAVNPTTTEICNSIDDDCDTQIDEGLTFTYYYADVDVDGFGAGAATNACAQPNGFVTTNTDCNNNNAAVNPAATEICNSIDDDCDTQIDEGVQINYYADTDGDGYGAGTATLACTAPTGFVTTSTDCNNTNPAVNPTATEICNSIDDDCDTQIDEGVLTTYYLDADVDSYGNAGSSLQGCTLPVGYVSNSSDCNDTNIAINPTTVWYLNADGDGYYVWTSVSCTSPGANYNTTGGIAGDCNDANAAVNAGATETCNGIDDDCDGLIDENSSNTY